MPRPVALVELGMEAQADIRALRKACRPLVEAAMASGNYMVMSETKALVETLRMAQGQAKALTGLAESSCPDGQIGLWHGRAA